MEGLIVLVILYSIIQKIAEKVKGNRQGNVPTKKESIKFPEPVLIGENKTNDKQANPDSFDPQNPFGSWEEIFFPKQSEPVTIKSKERPAIIADKRKGYTKNVRTVTTNLSSEKVQQGKRYRKTIQTRVSIDRESIRQGILWSEILGPPKSQLHWRNIQKSSQRV